MHQRHMNSNMESEIEKLDAFRKRLGRSDDDLFAIRFAINAAIATAIVATVLSLIGDSNPMWAIASMVAASDPQPGEAKRMLRDRLINVLVGCGIGLAFTLIEGAKAWLLPVAIGVSVLISALVVKVKTMWRQAPITAALIISTSLIHGSVKIGVVQGLHKVAEVIFGCIVGVLVSIVMSKLWPIKISDTATGFAKRNSDDSLP